MSQSLIDCQAISQSYHAITPEFVVVELQNLNLRIAFGVHRLAYELAAKRRDLVMQQLKQLDVRLASAQKMADSSHTFIPAV